MKSIIETYKKILMERKLTPAEIDKREEVALAIEREHPEMDDSKKMAIATSVAKDVSEEFLLETFDFDYTDGFLHLTEEQHILVENRVEFLKTAMKDKIDFSYDELGKHKDSDALIDHIANKVDPTAQKVHTQWVANQYRKGDIRQEDFPRVKKALKGFELAKKKLEVKDINQFKTVSDLEDHVATQKHRVEGEIKEKEQQSAEKSSPSGLEVLHKDEAGGTGVKINSRAASVDNYGPGGKLAKTNWCTAANSSNNMFNSYKGGKYVYHTPENRVLQFHHESGQIMDEKDQRVNLATNPAYAPHAESIKTFINKTAESEGYSTSKPSKLMQSTMSHMTQENVDALGEKHKAAFARNSYLDRNLTDSFETHPFKSDVFSAAMSYIHAKGGSGGDRYSNHHDLANSIAKNPNTPSHILDELHGMHTAQPNNNSGFIRSSIASNPATSGSTRDAYKEHPQFASRRDLSSDEIDHIMQTGDSSTKSLLAKNDQVSLSKEHQTNLYNDPSLSIKNAILSRGDLASHIADHHIDTASKATGLVDDWMSANAISKSSPEAITRNLSAIIKRHHQTTAYARDDLDADTSAELSKHTVPSETKPEHVDLKVAHTISKGRHDSVFNIPGITKDHANAAAEAMLNVPNTSIYTAEKVFEHPKVSEEIKGKILLNTSPSRSKEIDDTIRSKATVGHLNQIMAHPEAHHLKRLVAGAKNVQKSHFDELVKEPKFHASIVDSKSAPPSILRQLATSPSDYIRSKVKKHKNTPADVKEAISFDESKI